jgi:hypothetical protein
VVQLLLHPQQRRALLLELLLKQHDMRQQRQRAAATAEATKRLLPAVPAIFVLVSIILPATCCPWAAAAD